MKTLKCDDCGRDEEVDNFIKKVICVDCDKKHDLEKQLNQVSFKSVHNLKQHHSQWK